MAPVVREYGREHANAFGGLYIDQQQGGEVIGLFTADLVAHEAAIRAQHGDRDPDTALIAR